MQTINLQNYRLVKHYRRGGQGNIFLGHQVGHGVETKLREVVVKIIPATGFSEAVLGSLQHKNVVTVLDFGVVEDPKEGQELLLCRSTDLEFSEHDIDDCSDNENTRSFAWISMEYSQRGSLSEIANLRFKNGDAYSDPEIATILCDILRGLGHAHAQNIIHTDIKPGNVLYFESDDTWKISDFGIARRFNEDTVVAPQGAAQVHPGTAIWMAPEQKLGAIVTAATDIYAVGLIGYYLATGNYYETGRGTLDNRVLHNIISKCFNENPDERYQSAEEVLPVLTALIGVKQSSASGSGGIDTVYEDYLDNSANGLASIERVKATIALCDDYIDLLEDGCTFDEIYDFCFIENMKQFPEGSESVKRRIIELWRQSSIDSDESPYYWDQFNEYIDRRKLDEGAQEASRFLRLCPYEGWPADDYAMYNLWLYILDVFIRLNFSHEDQSIPVISDILELANPELNSSSDGSASRWADIKTLLSQEMVESGKTESKPEVSKEAYDLSILDEILKWSTAEVMHEPLRLSIRSEKIKEMADQSVWTRWADTIGSGWAFIGEIVNYSRWGAEYNFYHGADKFKVYVPIQITRNVMPDPEAFMLMTLEVPQDSDRSITESPILLDDDDPYWEYQFLTNFSNPDMWQAGDLSRYRRGVSGDYKYLRVPVSVFSDTVVSPPDRIRMTARRLPNKTLTELANL